MLSVVQNKIILPRLHKNLTIISIKNGVSLIKPTCEVFDFI